MEQGNKSVSLLAAVASGLGALGFVSVLAGVWNYSVVGNVFIASGALGTIGAIAGFVASRSGRNSLNALGLWLGLAVVAAVVAYTAMYTVGDVEVTEIQG